jgi:hypothetical protein
MNSVWRNGFCNNSAMLRRLLGFGMATLRRALKGLDE